ncbi:bromodomain adjacent to zinc finger domain protein 2B isoform X8 [Ctenopharyngodon idella]|uniref:bromodomain adjacent to zinc finger domain protein 2B isoform X8 n=1 Tax=Ctenopharyngodon idella TaxID=7959 RepID=UPI00222FA84E|nr:bromodomain adjacent to zinc finger domain protein 2B isoform X8 [Ctenopharyngodon idella]
MESAERLVSPTSSQTSIRAAANPEDSSPTTHSKSGHLFRMVGNQGLGISSVSGAFPMINHPAFSLHSSSPLRSEFGGLGTLGMSAALAARSQLGALPDWWRSADAQGQGSAAFFPHLLGLPALFSMSSLNHEQSLLQSHAPRRTPAKAGLNGSVNGKTNSSSASSTPSPALKPPDQTKSLKTRPKPALNQLEEKTRLKTKDQKLPSKVPDVSINSDSQSASSSDSSSDALSSSDSDDLEDVDDDDDDDDDDQSDDSVDLEKCGKDPKGIRKPSLPQEPIKQAFPPPLRDAQEPQSSQKLPYSPFLPSLPTENHHPSAVQDAPLALITKHRCQSTRVPDKPLLAATSPAYNTPINLTTTAARETGRTSTSPGPTPRAGRGKGCKMAQRTVKRERPSLVENFRGAESDLPDNKDSDDSLMEDEDENDISNDSLSDSDSNLDSDSDDDDGKDEELDTDLEMDRTPLKLTNSSASVLDSSHSSSPAPLNLQVHKTPVTATPTVVTNSGNSANHSPSFSSHSVSAPPGKRRRVTDESALRKPLEYGWQRETRITNVSGRLRGEVAYYAPCGRRLRQYPDVIKYLTRNGISDITRDHFSFSTKIKVGDFYEARDGPQGLQWCLLKEEEVIPRILAIEGRRGRLKNLDPLSSPAGDPARSRRKGRAPDESEADVLSTSEAKLLRKLEAQEIARQAAQMKLMRKLEKQALARAAKEARRQQAIMAAEERRKHKEQMKILKQQEKFKRIQQVRMEKELRARQILEAKRRKKEEAANAKILEAEKRIKEKELRRQQAIILKHQELERHRLDMVWERERRRQHVMLMKAMEARKKAEEKERLKREKRDEKRLNKERKLELRRLELEMAKELNKPNEDMCLSDLKPLPALSRIAGLVLPGGCFSDCLMVMQFLRCFGKVLGFDLSADMPSLGALQAGLLNVGDSMGFIQDLLVRMLSAAVCDPGLPPGHRAKTALGDHVTNIGLNRDNVSEVLQIYMEAHCGQTELAPLAESLKTKAFQAHTPSQKASILAFLVNELSCSKTVVSEIDKNIDNMTNLRRDKWLIEGNLRKLRSIYAKRTGKRESSVGGEEGHAVGTPVNSRKRKRKGGESDDDDEEDDDSDEQGEEDEDEDDFGGKKGKKAEACEDEDEGDQSTSIEELERQIEKLSKQQTQIRRKLFEASHSLRSVMFGQDRYKRRYWVLPQCGGIFVEGLESGEGPVELQRERERLKNAHLVQVKVEPAEEPDEKYGNTEVKREPPQNVDSLNLFLQKPGSFSKLSKLLEVAKMSSEVSCHQNGSPKQQTTITSSPDPDHSRLLNNTYLTNAQQQIRNDQLYKVLTERNPHWFSLLPRSPCDVSSLTESPHSASSSSSPQTSNGRARSPFATCPSSTAGINNFSLAALQMKSGVPIIDLPFCAWSNGNLNPNVTFSGISMAQILSGVHPLSEGNVSVSSSKSDSPESPAEKPLSTPSPAIEVARNQDYPSPEPIPEEMLTGWWKVTDIEELRSIEKACHSRGIREKQLQKQLQKHMDYIGQVCSRNRDVTVIDISELEENQVSEDTVQSWCVEEQAMDMDIGVLQQVEELEHKVTSASLQVKGWMHPVPQSQSEDLVYYEHKPVVDNCKESSDCGIVRRANNPLDIAVTRLAELERNIERRYLKSPLSSTIQIRLDNVGTVSVPAPAPSPARADGEGAEEDLAPGLRQWRKALSEVRSASQLSLCIQQLQKSIAWEKSIMKVYCQICHKGDNEELLLLCDGCDKGCHTYCHKPKITTIPDGDWFCPACISQASSQSLKTKKPLNRSSGGLKKPAEAKRHRKPSVAGDNSEDDSGSANSTPKKVSKEIKKRKTEENPSPNPACVKKPKTVRDDSKDLAMCRILLAELESHQDAGPFLTPVNSKSVPGYRKVIKKPMDFSTIRDKLTNSQYLNLETFIIDVNLVFDNCEKFNEDNSDIGRAGHTMRRFFQRRWTELLRQNSLKAALGT